MRPQGERDEGDRDLYEIECQSGCTCLVESLDGLEMVLMNWAPSFVSVRKVRLSASELKDRLEDLQGERGRFGCRRSYRSGKLESGIEPARKQAEFRPEPGLESFDEGVEGCLY